MLPLTKLSRYIHNRKQSYQYRIRSEKFGNWTYTSICCDILNDIRIGVRTIRYGTKQIDEFMRFDGYILYNYIYNVWFERYDTYMFKLEKDATYVEI